MPKPFSQKSLSSGLPLPSSSPRNRHGGGFGSGRGLIGRILAPVPPRYRKRTLLGLTCLTVIFFLSIITGHGPSLSSGINDPRIWRERTPEVKLADRTPPPGAAVNTKPAQPTRHGAVGSGYEREMHSEDEEMMLSENELAVDSEIEPAPVTLEDLQREEQQLVMREDTKKNQLRALIYWVEKGGVLPSWNFDLVDAQDLNSMSAKEFEDYLTGIEVAYQPEPNPFSIDGWEEDAATYQAMTVFSKSYCPYSKRAKTILNEYDISPPPFIVELDLRDDGSYIQDLLLMLTGRRTVPNVIVNFKSLGGSDEVNLLHQEGTLSRHIVTTSAGVLEGEVVDRELLERQVLERVLEGQAEDGGEDDKDDDGELESLE